MKLTLDYIYHGYIQDVVKDWDDQCIDAIVTSPPYYLKRKYDGHPKIWGGDLNCKHVWSEYGIELNHGGNTGMKLPHHKQGGQKCGLEINRATPGDKPSAKSIIPQKYLDDYENIMRPPIQTGFCTKCGAWYGDLGLEPHYSLYIKHLCDIFGSLWRVLKDEGTLWVNIGDSYNGSGGAGNQDTKYRRLHHTQFGKHVESETQSLPTNIKDYSKKCMLMIPQRFAMEMIDRGWILRNDNVWAKKGCFPESVTDRFTCSHEYIYMFSKKDKYFFNQQFVPLKDPTDKRSVTYGGIQKNGGGIEGYSNATYSGRKEYDATKLKGKNRRDVIWLEDGMTLVDTAYLEWLEAGMPSEGADSDVKHFATASFPGGHYAVFPEDIPEIAIDAGVPKDICTKCGKPRTWIKTFDNIDISGKTADDFETENSAKGILGTSRLYPTDRSCGKPKASYQYTICNCNAKFNPGVILDPFFGSGTTGIVALKKGVHFVGIEQSPKYVRMGNKRVMPYRTTRMGDLR